MLLSGRSSGATRNGETCNTALARSCVGVGVDVGVDVAVDVAVAVAVGVGVLGGVGSGESKGKVGVPLSGACARNAAGIVSSKPNTITQQVASILASIYR